MHQSTGNQLTGRIAWITGAGSGIGEAAALALAREGATIILSGRRREPLENVAAHITAAGGTAHVQPGDMTQSASVQAIASFIHATFGKLDIFVANAGLNIANRRWGQLTPQGADDVITANLSSVFYGIISVLPMMRAQQDGVIIITASVAGRFISSLGGPAYTAAKHGVVALSHSVNMEECVNGIRCTAVLPGEVATPILDKRPTPVSAEDRARMLQSDDVGDLIRYVACLPRHAVINEVMISPTWNRGYVRALGR
jgi:NADP-dependent 3-hydroxy acid dehydrogenase YdfG